MESTTAANMKILVLTKRQYMGKDLIDDRFGRFRELPFELARLGHEVKGISLSYRPKGEGTYADADPNHGVSVAWQSVDLGFLGLPRYCRQTRAIAVNFKADLVWACSDAYHAIIGGWLAKRIQTRCVIDLYDNFESFGASHVPFVLPLFRHAVKAADGVTCFSKRLADHVTQSNWRSKPTAVIENGVHKELFRPLDQQACRRRFRLPGHAKIIGTAGGLDSSHDIETLFRAFQILSNRRNDIDLAIAGPRRPRMRIPSGPKIHDLHTLSHQDVASFIGALDVCVIGYRQSAQGEFSFPQKAYEIMACRVPLVAAAVGSMNELLIDYPECLYQSENPASLADAIRRQLDSPILVNTQVPTWADSARELESFFAVTLSGRSTAKSCQSSIGLTD
jgi:teichuronic acid biosynthesis glycosyltransferase TuaC